MEFTSCGKRADSCDLNLLSYLRHISQAILTLMRQYRKFHKMTRKCTKFPESLNTGWSSLETGNFGG